MEIEKASLKRKAEEPLNNSFLKQIKLNESPASSPSETKNSIFSISL